jgi:hypothetical protein
VSKGAVWLVSIYRGRRSKEGCCLTVEEEKGQKKESQYNAGTTAAATNTQLV